MKLPPLDPSRRIVLFTDFSRGSYAVIGALYKLSLQKLGIEPLEVKIPETAGERMRAEDSFKGAIVIHGTIGPLFSPVKGAVNIAAPFHEWSDYPSEWVNTLNQFDEVWAASAHIKTTLEKSGVDSPVLFMPPALDIENIPVKTSWDASKPFRFLSVGEAHFRKGFHLLMEGFMKAFPKKGEAALTIKTSADCTWKAPREDITLIAERLPRDRALDLYRRSDVYVSASLGEGLGLPLAEAAQAMLPIAANYWGGHKDLLVKNGFFKIPCKTILQPFCSNPSYFAPGQKCGYSSPDDISKTLKQAFKSSAAARKRMAQKAISQVVSRYGSDASLSRLGKRFGL